MDVRELAKATVMGSRSGMISSPDSTEFDFDATIATAQAEGFYVLQSCHSTWLFDTTDHRFCRVLRGSQFASSSVATDWRSYDRLVLSPDSDAFVVFLDASGTKILRSWRHTAHCDQCGGEVTAEMSLADLRRVTGA
jgi:hypothetical protein